MRSVVEAVERQRQTLAATAAGYAMTLQRVERAMAQHGLEAIPAVSQPFDPELMEVLEVVLDSGAPSGEVVQEVRRGYLWNGRVFRYAQVRVAKNSV
jgi:molecular chaperone GrpE